MDKLKFSDILADDLDPSLRQYDEVTNIDRAFKKVETFLEEQNIGSKKPMNLILFEFALDHLLKIIRILKMQRGNALLIGLGGSGRQSLTRYNSISLNVSKRYIRLASYIRDFNFYDIELSKNYGIDQWRQDMQRVNPYNK